jgi:nucleoside-diphosphate-sugar epimerase
MIIDRQPDEERRARRWSARRAGPAGVTEAGALWALKEQQPGDVPQTWADVSHAGELFDYKPTTSFKKGVTAFYEWWKSNKI